MLKRKFAASCWKIGHASFPVDQTMRTFQVEALVDTKPESVIVSSVVDALERPSTTARV